MYVVAVDITVKPGQMAAFLPIMQTNATASRQTEPGCQRFDVCVSDAEPDKVFLYEVYDDAAAFAAHKATDHFATFEREGGPLMADKTAQIWTIANG